MQPLFRGFTLGDRVEEKFTFSNEELQHFHRIIHPSSTIHCDKFLVDFQLLASRALTLVVEIFFGKKATPVQQEVIFLEPVYTLEVVSLKTELVALDRSNNWVTLSLECFNPKGAQVMTGQIVMDYGKIENKGVLG